MTTQQLEHYREVFIWAAGVYGMVALAGAWVNGWGLVVFALIVGVCASQCARLAHESLLHRRGGVDMAAFEAEMLLPIPDTSAGHFLPDAGAWLGEEQALLDALQATPEAWGGAATALARARKRNVPHSVEMCHALSRP